MFQKGKLVKTLRNHIQKYDVKTVTIYDSEFKYNHEVKIDRYTRKPVITNSMLIDIYGDEWANITTDKGLSITIVHEFGYSEVHDCLDNEVSLEFSNELEG